MQKELVRLSKLMSMHGLCSRREADQLIAKGWVKVDGHIVKELGTKVDPGAKIKLSREATLLLDRKVTILLNKPIGYLSSPTEKNYPLAVELIRPENLAKENRSVQKFHPSHRNGLAAAGRLDIDSKGLLLLTQDGVLAKTVIGEHSSIEKEYLVRVEGQINQAKIKSLCFGLQLDGKSLKPAKVKELQAGLLQFILKEGKKRQIRRMCLLVDLKVLSIKRVRIGQIRLGKLKEGQWRYLKPDEKP
ncbi:MAG: rRNA pseudouridine synthase [Bdellovibrionales bacterium]|nr:rRNA pseudouridine synthase [Bdellovibrionales bacterium]